MLERSYTYICVRYHPDDARVVNEDSADRHVLFIGDSEVRFYALEDLIGLRDMLDRHIEEEARPDTFTEEDVNTTQKHRIPFTMRRNDLFARLYCTCPAVFDGVEHDLLKHSIQLTGYNDDYFFNVANKEPRERECRCGRRYRVQWFRDGVEAEFIDPPKS